MGEQFSYWQLSVSYRGYVGFSRFGLSGGTYLLYGGQHTAARTADLTAIARACGYPKAVCVRSFEELDAALEEAKSAGELRFIEAKCAIGARADLGRPTTTAKENKENFMAYLNRRTDLLR